MKVMDQNPESWGRKINFVDASNVVVGFDYASRCCESFGYLLTYDIPKTTEDNQIEPELLEPYSFDTTYKHDEASSDSDGGGSITFRLTAEGRPDVYLTLYNHHNGYYSHGFEMTQGGESIVEGSL